MKTLNIVFSEEEFAALVKAKYAHQPYRTWKDFLLYKCLKEKSYKEIQNVRQT